MTSAGSYTESHAVAQVRYGINSLQKLQVDKKHFYALNRVSQWILYRIITVYQLGCVPICRIAIWNTLPGRKYFAGVRIRKCSKIRETELNCD